MPVAASGREDAWIQQINLDWHYLIFVGRSILECFGLTPLSKRCYYDLGLGKEEGEVVTHFASLYPVLQEFRRVLVAVVLGDRAKKRKEKKRKRYFL